MNPQLKQLIDLQAIDTQIREIEHLFNSVSDTHQKALDLKQTSEGELEVLRSEISELGTQVRQALAVLEMNDERLKKAEDKGTAIQNQREFGAVQKELQTLKNHSDKIQKKKQEIEAQLNEKKQREEELIKTLQDAESTIDTEKTNREDRLKGEGDRLTTLKADKEVILKGLQPVLKASYQRLFDFAKKGIAVAPMVNGICTACRVSLRPQLSIQVQRGDTLQNCEICGRFLYHDEAPKDSSSTEENGATP